MQRLNGSLSVALVLMAALAAPRSAHAVAQMYESVCHEVNFDIVHLLTGARNREKNPSLNLQPAKR